jgi:secreted trypsin-like serine protease
MKKLLMLALATAAATVVAVGPAGAVQGGTPDSATSPTYPYVGLSVFYEDGVPLWRCSGTLISPTVYVTAGHCTGVDPDTGAVPDRAQIWFGAGPIPFGNYAGGPCAGSVGYPCQGDVGGTPNPMPGWNGFLTVPNTHDTGVVVLDRPVALPKYATLAPVGYLDGLAKKRGKQNVNFTVVGYGVQFERPNLEVAVRQRFIGTTQLQDLGSHLAGGYEVRMTDSSGNGTGGSGTCFGDSGGPVLHTADDGTQYLVGDISWGTKYCKGTSAAFRLDAPDAHAFVTSFVH